MSGVEELRRTGLARDSYEAVSALTRALDDLHPPRPATTTHHHDTRRDPMTENTPSPWHEPGARDDYLAALALIVAAGRADRPAYESLVIDRECDPDRDWTRVVSGLASFGASLANMTGDPEAATAELRCRLLAQDDAA